MTWTKRQVRCYYNGSKVGEYAIIADFNPTRLVFSSAVASGNDSTNRLYEMTVADKAMSDGYMMANTTL